MTKTNRLMSTPFHETTSSLHNHTPNSRKRSGIQLGHSYPGNTIILRTEYCGAARASGKHLGAAHAKVLHFIGRNRTVGPRIATVTRIINPIPRAGDPG